MIDLERGFREPLLVPTKLADRAPPPSEVFPGQQARIGDRTGKRFLPIVALHDMRRNEWITRAVGDGKAAPITRNGLDSSRRADFLVSRQG